MSSLFLDHRPWTADFKIEMVNIRNVAIDNVIMKETLWSVVCGPWSF